MNKIGSQPANVYNYKCGKQVEFSCNAASAHKRLTCFVTTGPRSFLLKIPSQGRQNRPIIKVQITPAGLASSSFAGQDAGPGYLSRLRPQRMK